MIFYIDENYKCYTENNGNLREYSSDFFNGKCKEFIEGYRYIPDGECWTRADGIVLQGESLTPWVDYNVLDAAQFQYERSRIGELENIVIELDTALLDTTYQNIIGGV